MIKQGLIKTAVEYATLAATAASHDDSIETGKLIVKPVPDPAADIFECRHLQPGDLIQVIVVEFGAHFGDTLFDLAEIAQPFLLLVGFALEKDLNLERVTMEP